MRNVALFGMAASIGLSNAAALIWRLQPHERVRIATLFGFGAMLGAASIAVYGCADNPGLDIRPLRPLPRIEANRFAKYNSAIASLLAIVALFVLISPKAGEENRASGLLTTRALGWASANHLALGVLLPAIADAVKACASRLARNSLAQRPITVVPGIPVAVPTQRQWAQGSPMAAVDPPAAVAVVPSAPPASPHPNELPQALSSPERAFSVDVVAAVPTSEEPPCSAALTH